MRGTRVLMVLMGTVWLIAGGPLVTGASAGWTTADGIRWQESPSPSKVGKCIGNCGADCSNSLNPCKGSFRDTGYWSSEYIWGPNFVRRVDSSNVCCEEFEPQWYHDGANACYGYYYEYHYDEYEAALRFTYHGVYSNFCSDHDHACRSKRKVYGAVYCVFPLDFARACSGAHYQTWSHEKYSKGEKNGYRHVTSWGHGPC